MRFKSEKQGGLQVFAVSGVNTISFAIDATTTARKGLLGFAVERIDPQKDERYFMPGFKVFPSIIPHPTPETQVSTFAHPVQSLVWDDFTAQPGYSYEYLFYPVRGKPKNLDRSAPPLSLKVVTEPQFTAAETHDVFFNRGVASSQAYARKFQNKKPDDLKPAAKAQEARDWLSRKLDDAILKFIGQAAAGDGLRCCFYEFRYAPVADALKSAIDRGVDVRLIVDAKINETTDSDGKIHGSFPREENLALIRKTKIPKQNVIHREARAGAIAHNKFMVLLKGSSQKPTEVWTGSTNISDGGIHGQTNVGHWVRDPQTAVKFLEYWKLLSNDPGARKGDDKAGARKKNAEFRKAVEALGEVPPDLNSIPKGITPIFSPRTKLDALNLYVSLLDSATALGCITLAFGINTLFKTRLADNTPNDQLILMLLEKRDSPKSRSSEPFLAINSGQNIYQAWGEPLDDAICNWLRETTTGALGLNSHVRFIHSKILLVDPLGNDPIVVTGSANFSTASIKENDENMLIIRGDTRVADIYFTEFNRLFNHYYFRAITAATKSDDQDGSLENLFLKENAEEWLTKYAPGKLRQKRVEVYTGMKSFEASAQTN